MWGHEKNIMLTMLLFYRLLINRDSTVHYLVLTIKHTNFSNKHFHIS